MFERGLAVHVRHLIFEIRRSDIDRREVIVFYGVVLAFGNGPNRQITVGRFDITLGHFLAEDGGVVDAFVFNTGALAVDVELVDGTVAVVPLDIFPEHGRADGIQPGVIHGGRRIAQEGGKLHWSEGFIPSFVEMNPVDSQRGPGFAVKVERGVEKVYKGDLVGCRHLRHERSVELEILVGGRSVREVAVLQVFVGDGRKKHKPRVAPAIVGFEGGFDILVKVFPECLHAGKSLERFVETPVG